MRGHWLRGILLGVSLALLLAGGVALANTGIIHSSWGAQPVAIDGSIGEGEWGDATVVDITCVGTQKVTAYVKNNADYLYLAVDNPNIPMDIFGSEMGIVVDDKPMGAHDGTWSYPACPSDEGAVLLRSPQACGTPTSCSLFVGYIWQMGPQACPDVQPAPGVSWEVSWAGGHFQWEAQVDLAVSPLKALPGQTIGFYLYVADEAPFAPNVFFNGEWPCGLHSGSVPPEPSDNPADFGDLMLAREPGVEDFVPEPGTIMLLGSGLVGLAGYATLRWRTRE